MDPVLGTVLGKVGGALLGGLFGKKKQTTTSYVDYGRMVRDSSAAGFNPLTALQNGGSQGFAVTETPTLATQNALASALGAGVETLFNKDQIKGDAEMRKLELEIRREELKNLQSAGSVLFEKSPFGPTNIQQYGVRNENSSPSLGGSLPSGNGVRVAGHDVDDNTDYSATQAVEDVYGDPVSWGYGIAKLGADAAKYIGKLSKKNNPQGGQYDLMLDRIRNMPSYTLPELAPHAAKDSFYEPWPW